jgi:hypothetical protein
VVAVCPVLVTPVVAVSGPVVVVVPGMVVVPGTSVVPVVATGPLLSPASTAPPSASPARVRAVQPIGVLLTTTSARPKSLIPDESTGSAGAKAQG